ncbi:terminase small subunit [Arthrobacter phage Kumotta]|uniref:Terminase small subunit n=1 Tax=Arthrobacter phage Kumotta TaxID=2588498 RepID=A0A4Y6EM13_9CAUD|nr:terminase small subunit [Arthrobacter phage Kumotta]QDF19512.1 hypothetical protein SEA_KUMOTTA_2 [Arthrobacter phage Kumotta]
MTARKLKAVPDKPSEDDLPEPQSPSSVKAAAAGSYRELLVALRDNIAGQIDAGIQARDLAALSRRLLEISKEIEGIDAADKGDDIGEAAVTPDEEWGSG